MKVVSVKVKLKYAADATVPLSEAGKKFGEEYNQFDRVFIPRGWEKVYQKIDIVPRLIIRTETINKKQTHLMMFKRPVDDNYQLVFQSQIMDYNQIANIVFQMGYELYAEVPKTRRKLVIGKVKFYLDEIDQYGYYLKIEKTLDDNELANRDELWELVETLDLKQADTAERYSDIIKKGKNERE